MHCWSAASSHCSCSKQEKPEQVIILFPKYLGEPKQKTTTTTKKAHIGEKTEKIILILSSVYCAGLKLTMLLNTQK